jgi:MATE family multidrug resistance protein
METLAHPPARPIGARDVLALAWPILVSMLSLTALGIVDTLLVSSLGTTALAAAGLGLTTSYVVIAFGNGLLQGAKVRVAHRTGAGDHAGADRLAAQALWLAAGLSLVSVGTAPFAPHIVAAMGATPESAGDASALLAIRLSGAPLLFATIALSAFHQGRGATHIPMVANVFMYGTNILLDIALVRGVGPIPAIGVPGVGLAAATGWGCGFACVLFASRRVLGRTPWRWLGAEIREIASMGAPLGTQMALDISSYALFASLLVRIGEAELAAHVVAMRIISVSFLPGYAIGEAGSVLVGHAIGAGDVACAASAWRAATRVAVALMLACGLAFVAVPAALVAPFHPTADVAAIAIRLLWIAAAFQVLDGVATTAYGALTGAGDTRFAMVTTILATWLVKLPLAVLLAAALELGAAGAWIALFGEICVLAVLGTWRIRSGGWVARAEDPEHRPVPALAA